MKTGEGLRVIHKVKWKNSWQSPQGWKITNFPFPYPQKVRKLIQSLDDTVIILSDISQIWLTSRSPFLHWSRTFPRPMPRPLGAVDRTHRPASDSVLPSLQSLRGSCLLRVYISPRTCPGDEFTFLGRVRKILGSEPGSTLNLANVQPLEMVCLRGVASQLTFHSPCFSVRTFGSLWGSDLAHLPGRS